MKRLGYYVRLGGDAEVSETLRRGDRALLLPAPRERNDACRRVAMWQRTPQEWARMTRRARKKYRGNRMPDGLAGALLVGYAMMCYGVQAGFEALWGAIEGRRRRRC